MENSYDHSIAKKTEYQAKGGRKYYCIIKHSDPKEKCRSNLRKILDRVQ